MKKSIRKSSRRKRVVGGIAFFGSIALLTTGFATWVIGAQQSADNDEITVGVDTVENSSVILTVTVDSSDYSLFLAETKAVEPGAGVIVSAEVDGTPDFSIELSNIKVEIGKQVLDDYNKISLDIAPDKTAPDDKGYAKNTVTTNPTGVHGEAGSWTYLALKTKEINFKGEKNAAAAGWKRTPTDDLDANTIIYETTEAITVEFDWGTYFGRESPATFYNKKYGDLSSDLSASVSNINQEMKAMSDALNGKKMVITSTLVA